MQITITGLSNVSNDSDDYQRAHDAATAVLGDISPAMLQCVRQAYEVEGEDGDNERAAYWRANWQALLTAASNAAHAAGTKGWAYPEAVFVQAEVDISL